jgi:hypothetical protein
MYLQDIPGEGERNEMVLRYLEKTSERKFREFCKVLDNTKQSQVTYMLQEAFAILSQLPSKSSACSGESVGAACNSATTTCATATSATQEEHQFATGQVERQCATEGRYSFYSGYPRTENRFKTSVVSRKTRREIKSHCLIFLFYVQLIIHWVLHNG